MCIESTLNKMLTISRILTQLSVDRMNIAGKLYSDSKYIGASEDSLEESFDQNSEVKKFSNDVVEVFLHILNLIQTKTDSPQEKNAVLDNVGIYLEMLRDLLKDFSVFPKQAADQSILEKYTAADAKLIEAGADTTATRLLLCKRDIFV